MAKMKKKGFAAVIFGLVAAAIAIIVLAVALGLGGKVLTDLGTGATAGSALANATNYGGQGINTMSSYLPLIGTIIIITALLVILIVYLAKRFQGGSM